VKTAKFQKMRFAQPAFILPFLFLVIWANSLKISTPLSEYKFRQNPTIGCAPNTGDNYMLTESGKFITLLPGWGQHRYPISSKVDSATIYFNQGLNMYYSYHAREAIASFKEAARFDPSAVMAYWGEALAMGPGYNFAHIYRVPEAIPAVLRLLNDPGNNCSTKEKDLVSVMNLRYQVDSSSSKKIVLNESYSEGMRKLMNKYPEDLDIKALYVDAVMLEHPWNFWNNDGSPKEWTPELASICESILKKNPAHPAALHYYIHVTEASRHPEVALSSADALKDLLPGVAHMVHMSSHEYERNGLYAKGVEANNKADDNLIRYDSLAKNLFTRVHIPHYFAVQSYCALSGGMYNQGMPLAFRCRNSVTPAYENTYDQYLYMMPVLAMVRLGKWQEILSDKIIPDPHWPYAGILYDFAKGLALLHTGSIDSADRRLKMLQEKITDSILKDRRIPFNTALQGAAIAENILQAEILFKKKKKSAAIRFINKAILAEDSLIYTEPKDWMIPARQFLGAYLLKMKKPVQAEKVYRDDLIWNPGNGWSLLGLYQSLMAQNKSDEAIKYKSAYLTSLSAADKIPPGSVFD
jgi:tetratricopeptide (TPR) repeat protein